MRAAHKKSRRAGPQKGKRHKARSARRDRGSVTWIRELAAPYLKGYQPVAASGGSLRGYWFLDSANPGRGRRNSGRGNPPFGGQAAGFYVGYLLEEEGLRVPAMQPPECIVFAWVFPVGSAFHSRLVRAPGSLLRKTSEYIRWLTHRPPRFEFHEMELPALLRHQSMRDWPAAKRQHLSRNFFIETLAWLVRSGLVRKLGKEAR